MGNKTTNLERMYKGKKITVSGFAFAVVGLVIYCFLGLTQGVHLEITDIFERGNKIFSSLSILLIILGTVLWLIGQIIYLRAAVDQSFKDEKDSGV